MTLENASCSTKFLPLDVYQTELLLLVPCRYTHSPTNVVQYQVGETCYRTLNQFDMYSIVVHALNSNVVHA